MLLIGARPSRGVNWLALSRMLASPARRRLRVALLEVGPEAAAAGVVAAAGSRCVSVKPRPYVQSCMRLCGTKRFTMAASRSASCGLSSVAGSQSASYHGLVQVLP